MAASVAPDALVPGGPDSCSPAAISAMAADPYAYKRDAKLQQQLLNEVVQLVSEPANSVCADCSAALRPRSAFCSVTLGVWLCNRCYGIHRSVGAHVTRTRCVGLDAWSPDEVTFMRAHGNARAAAVYEANVPAGRERPTATSPDRDAERWIRDKYEHRLFVVCAKPAEAARPAGGQREPTASAQPQAVELISFDLGGASSTPGWEAPPAPPASWQAACSMPPALPAMADAAWQGLSSGTPQPTATPAPGGALAASSAFPPARQHAQPYPQVGWPNDLSGTDAADDTAGHGGACGGGTGGAIHHADAQSQAAAKAARAKADIMAQFVTR